MRSKAGFCSLNTHRDQMRAGLTDCHTNRGALCPSGFHPHEKQSAAESGKGWGLQITHKILLFFSSSSSFSVYNNNNNSQCHHKALQEKEAFRLIGVSPSTPYTITGYAAAVIKAPFQHSTHRDLFQSKHSLSQLNPRPIHWTFLCLQKRKKKIMYASNGMHWGGGKKRVNPHYEGARQLRQWTLEETEYPW